MRKVFLGAPCAGKGEASSRIAPVRGVAHISTGDLFRENIRNGTDIGLKAKGYMDAGGLVPDEIVVEMLADRIAREDCRDGFILDGFPRTIGQAERLAELTDIDAVIYINAADDVIVKRMGSRISCKDCGKVFNAINSPPKVEGVCDSCSGDVVRRKDDEPHVAEKRIATYREQTEPLISYYKDKGLLRSHFCDDFGQSPQELADCVLDLIEGFEKSSD